MSHFHRNSTWQVELPDEWKVHALMFSYATIYRPDGVGQLPGFHHDRAFGGSNSRSWTLFCGKHVLLIRYSCAADHAGVEDEEVDLIVSSIARSDGTEQDQD